ncbi:hypothetical protein [Hydrogenophaga sp.]|uniref:hypothetical protein n=1 Tax=Hydrogenophaga sp. TaxID=1904254 RepID=UPI0027184C8B|nr:hypothetical protein [Hydrogenophaga sp.]MDO9435614.1 hypothetical protein [Hydrogenophaga sp.]
MRHLLIALPLLLLQVPAAQAQVAVNIGINFPAYPQMVLVPDYPVYYAPEAPGNFFFYDGYYWVFEDDTWYYSSWYNGPWYAIAPEYVPEYLLRVPVRYYRRPPIYFSYWRVDAPPRWGDHWGPGWSQRRSGWDQWDRRRIPLPAPLPDYQRKYPQSRYPQPGQQDNIRIDNYRYQPRESVIRQQLATQPGAMPPRRGDVRGSEQVGPQTPGIAQPQPGSADRGFPGQRGVPSPMERGNMRQPDQAETQAPRFERSQPRAFEREAPGQRMAPSPMERGNVRQSDQRAAPAPQMPPPMAPQMPPPQMSQPQPQLQPRPDFQPRPQPQQQQPRAEPPPPPAPGMGPGSASDRMPGQRRLDDGMRGR